MISDCKQLLPHIDHLSSINLIREVVYLKGKLLMSDLVPLIQQAIMQGVILTKYIMMFLALNVSKRFFCQISVTHDLNISNLKIFSPHVKIRVTTLFID